MSRPALSRAELPVNDLSVTQRALRDAEPGLPLQPGDRVGLLAPRPQAPLPESAAAAAAQTADHAKQGRS